MRGRERRTRLGWVGFLWGFTHRPRYFLAKYRPTTQARPNFWEHAGACSAALAPSLLARPPTSTTHLGLPHSANQFPVSQSTVLSETGEAMAAGSKDGSVPAGGWRAEEAVAGNRTALQALRELVVYPFIYARESRLLGLKVPFSSAHQSQHSARLPLTNFYLRVLCELVFCSGPEDCCSTAPLVPER
jgi:hypothetical protein